MRIRKATSEPLGESEARAAHVAELLKALAHPIRIRLVAVLCQGEMHVGALAERLGVQQAVVSQQLRILRMRGLVAVARQGGLAVYRLAEPRLRDLVDCMEGCSRSYAGGSEDREDLEVRGAGRATGGRRR